MLSHFLNVSFTLPQGLEPDKGQDYWWLHVVFPYFILFTAQQGGGNHEERKVRSQRQSASLHSQNQDKEI